jgi:hypothetical protein
MDFEGPGVQPYHVCFDTTNARARNWGDEHTGEHERISVALFLYAFLLPPVF